MDNIRKSEQNNKQDNREFRDNFKNIKDLMDDSNYSGGDAGGKQDQEQKNRELRDNFKNIHEFMKNKGYE